jgi:glutamine cyclotransferase
MKTFLLSAVTFAFLMTGCTNTDTNADNSSNEPQTPVISYSIVASYPHDTSSFTQGLTFYQGHLLEGTGNKGQSKLMQVDLKTGNAVKKIELDKNFFGEGITVLNDTIYQLTWQEKVVLVYNAKDLKLIKQMPLSTEGWGITDDGKNLIITDGSNNLYFYEPATFRLLRTQSVTENGSPAVNLNELEYINGFIYANQWQYNYILKIDPASGQVLARTDQPC